MTFCSNAYTSLDNDTLPTAGMLFFFLNGSFTQVSQIGEVVSTIPSELLLKIFFTSKLKTNDEFEAIGFNVETVEVNTVLKNFFIWRANLVLNQYKNIKFQVWDLGGQSSIRRVTKRDPDI